MPAVNFSVEIKDIITGPSWNRLLKRKALNVTFARERTLFYIFHFMKVGDIECVGIKHVLYVWKIGDGGCVSLFGFPLCAWMPADMSATFGTSGTSGIIL